MSDLVTRLRHVESSTLNMSNSVTASWYRNPDGPEAADEIERLTAERDELAKRVEELESRFGAALMLSEQNAAQEKRGE